MIPAKARKKPSAIVAGVLATVAGAALGKYTGAILLIPILFVVIIGWTLSKTFLKPKYFRGAIVITIAHVFCLVLGWISTGNSSAAPDILLITAGLIWLWLRPSFRSSLFLGAIQVLTGALLAFALTEHRPSSDTHRAITAHIGIKIIAVGFLVEGYRRWKEGHAESPAPKPPVITVDERMPAETAQLGMRTSDEPRAPELPATFYLPFLLWKDKLTVTGDTIECRGITIRCADVTSVQAGIDASEKYGLQIKTEYRIELRTADYSKFTTVEFSNLFYSESKRTLFDSILDCFMHVAGKPLAARLVDSISEGKEITIGNLHLIKTGIKFPSLKLFSSDRIFVAWSEVRSALTEGTLEVSSLSDPNLLQQMSLSETPNAVLMPMISAIMRLRALAFVPPVIAPPVIPPTASE